MDLKKALSTEHSKKQTLAIVAWIGSNGRRFSQLMAIFRAGDHRLTQRAAWPLMHVAQEQPQLIRRYIPQLLNLLSQPLHVAVRRNVLRLLQDIPITEKDMGIAADTCFRFLRSPQEPIAVRAFAMTVLLQICRKWPEMKQELRISIEELLPFASPGLRNRAQKTLRALERL